MHKHYETQQHCIFLRMLLPEINAPDHNVELKLEPTVAGFSFLSIRSWL